MRANDDLMNFIDCNIETSIFCDAAFKQYVVKNVNLIKWKSGMLN